MKWLSGSVRFSTRRQRRVLAAAALACLVIAGTAAAVTTRTAVAPSNSSRPTIGGETAVGSTVTANPGTWGGSSPIGFQYQWRICDAGGAACHDIGGATGQTYQIRSGDQGNTLRVNVIGSNSDGSGSAVSEPSAKIAAISNAPANTSPPTISGTAAVGATLTANPGTWSGAAPITFQYVWQVCDGSGNACHDVSAATGQTYQPKSADPGNTLRVRVTASNSDGSSSVTSGPSSPVTAPAPSPATCTKTTASQQAVAVNDVAAPDRLVVDHVEVTSGQLSLGMGSFSARFHVSNTCGQAVSGAVVYATAVPYGQVTIPAEAATDGSGWVTLSFNRLAGFPLSSRRRRLVLFVRARKSGEPILAGISGRRLVSLRLTR
jgi:hypothetical protein